MTWEEIRRLQPWLPESSDGWHQHERGGGWVRDGVYVAPRVRVMECAVFHGGVFHDGEFHGGVFYGGEFYDGEFHGGVFHGGVFHGGVFHGGVFYGGEFYGGEFYDGEFRGGVFRGGEFRDGVFHGGVVRDGVFRGGVFRGGVFYGGVFHDGEFHGGVFHTTPLLIYGSRYWIGWSGKDLVSSGCITKPLEWWLENVERCAEENGYSTEEQAEYREHIEHIARWMRRYGVAATN